MLLISKRIERALVLQLGILLLTSGLAHAQANYRTVVIFGDTQTVVNGNPDQYADFTAQVDWVIANKYTENIDFVLHVGDIIDLGTFLPTPASCIGQPNVPLGTCLSSPSCNPAPAGCYEMSNGGGGFDCISCSFPILSVPPQWQLFRDQWSRLDPDPGSGWSGMPYAIVRGNHDNVGVDPDTEQDVNGFTQFYSDAYFEGLEADFAGSDRHYEHLESYPGEDMDGHVWLMHLGNRPVLVVGPSYEGGEGTSQQQIDWVVDVFSRYPNAPAILLVHDMIQYGQLNSAVLQQAPTVAPSLFLAAQGHIGGDQKYIQTIGGTQDVIRTVSDWSRIPSPGGSYFAILRFYFEPGMPDEVEAFTYSPVLDVVVPDANKTIEKQVFPVPEPSSEVLQGAGLLGLVFLQWLRRLFAKPAQAH